MLNQRNFRPGPARQKGVVLFVSLILLLILSLIGVTAARMQTVEERMARNENNHQLASQAAEAALRGAESGLLSGIYSNFAGNTNGLYDLAPSTGSVVPTLDWTVASSSIAYTGPAMLAVNLAQPPQFVIENLPPVAIPGDSISEVQYAAPTPPVAVYRVTAFGVGGDATSTTTIQSIFR
jgi:type IV pilus assembly protein PilX